MLDGRIETTPLHILCIERPTSERQSTSNESLMEIDMGQNVESKYTRKRELIRCFSCADLKFASQLWLSDQRCMQRYGHHHMPRVECHGKPLR